MRRLNFICMNSSYSDRQRQFEEYLRDGISAVKNGEFNLASRMLNRALMLNNADARPYVWLSATTEDPKEQLEYLEKAVALEPTNVTARRGIAMLTGKLDPNQVLGAGTSGGRAGNAVGAAPETEVKGGQVFQCPNCGGRMSFDVRREILTCEYCGHSMVTKGRGGYIEGTEQVLDFVMPTDRGHRWARAEQQFKCEKCGALSVLPPGQSAVQCPYCASNQMVQSDEHNQLVPPNAVILMKLDEAEAIKQANHWLGRGMFAPDTLHGSQYTMRLRPAYYSCWTFDGTVEMRWSCEVSDGSGNSKRWIHTNGVEARFFNDILVSGVKSLPNRELERLGPFELALGEVFQPDYLAGWPAILYNISLSDASLSGRELVLRRLRPQLQDLIEPGREKRNLSVGSGNWSGLTFKHVLVPLWLGEYSHQGKSYRLYVNGQSGKVVGEKPRDTLKVVMSIVIGLLLLGLLIFGLYILSEAGII